MSIETNWYVITGGPHSGKSGAMDSIAFLGYPIIPEAARILIDNERSKGRTTEEIRADENAFQREVFKMKVEAEGRIPPERLTFLDRGIPDSIAYYQLCGEDITPVVEASKNRRYKGVFLLELLEEYKKDYARTEDKEMALKLQDWLRQSYSFFGYDVILVPELSCIEERAEFILSKIKI